MFWLAGLKSETKQHVKAKEPTGKAKLNLTIDLYLWNLIIFKAHCPRDLGACLKVFEISRLLFPRKLCQGRNLIYNFLIILAVFTAIAHPVSTNGDHIKYTSRYMKEKRIYLYNLTNFVSFCQFCGH